MKFNVSTWLLSRRLFLQSFTTGWFSENKNRNDKKYYWLRGSLRKEIRAQTKNVTENKQIRRSDPWPNRFLFWSFASCCACVCNDVNRRKTLLFPSSSYQANCFVFFSLLFIAFLTGLEQISVYENRHRNDCVGRFSRETIFLRREHPAKGRNERKKSHGNVKHGKT